MKVEVFIDHWLSIHWLSSHKMLLANIGGQLSLEL